MFMQVISYCLPDVASLTSELDSCFGTETLETVKCGTGDGVGPVSTWEEISVALWIWSNQQSSQERYNLRKILIAGQYTV